MNKKQDQAGAESAAGDGGRELPAQVIASADDLANELRHQIQNGELVPGEWLREARLCSEFGIGRSIARRALRALADDGLVELEEHRGARVSATTVEEVFDLYEIRAALYGLAARFACLRASPQAVTELLVKIDQLLSAAEQGVAAEQIIDMSETIFSDMSGNGSPDARRMIDVVRRKTRWHFSYVALALAAKGAGPWEYWRRIRAALVKRDADTAAQAARELIYFMQTEVSRIMLAHGPRREPQPAPAGSPRKTRTATDRR